MGEHLLVTAWRFYIDGDENDTTSRMAAAGGFRVVLHGDKYVFESIEYLVRNSEINYVTGTESTSIADVHLATAPAE